MTVEEMDEQYTKFKQNLTGEKTTPKDDEGEPSEQSFNWGAESSLNKSQEKNTNNSSMLRQFQKNMNLRNIFQKKPRAVSEAYAFSRSNSLYSSRT